LDRKRWIGNSVNKSTNASGFIKTLDHLQSLPDHKSWLGDYEVEMRMLDGSWHLRRIIWNKEKIFLSRSGEHRVFESIPLTEISKVFIEDQTHGKKKSSTDVRPRVTHDPEQITAAHQPDPASANGTPSNVFWGKFATVFNHTRPSLIARLSNKQSEGQVQSTFRGKGYRDILQIKTVVDGYNCGRTYHLRFRSNQLCAEVLRELNLRSNAAVQAEKQIAWILQYQGAARTIYESSWFQLFTALLITGNFAINIAQAQLNNQLVGPDGSPTETSVKLSNAEFSFTVLFTVELLFHAYARWGTDFWKERYNVVDIIAVSLSWAALGGHDLSASTVRMIRAFRVFRLIGKNRTFRAIAGTFLGSIIPVFNVYIILLLFVGIYAVIGVTYFSVDAPLEFGIFHRAVISLLRLPAGDAWLDGLPRFDWGAAGFVDTFIFVVNWTLLPIAVALLINNFIVLSENDDASLRECARALLRRIGVENHPLDPLVENLIRQFVDDGDLTDRLSRMFQDLDLDGSGWLNFNELCAALKNLEYHPRIHMTELDFSSFTDDGRFCDEVGRLDADGFEQAMRRELRRYVHRNLADVLCLGNPRSLSELDDAPEGRRGSAASSSSLSSLATANGLPAPLPLAEGASLASLKRLALDFALSKNAEGRIQRSGSSRSLVDKVLRLEAEKIRTRFKLTEKHSQGVALSENKLSAERETSHHGERGDGIEAANGDNLTHRGAIDSDHTEGNSYIPHNTGREMPANRGAYLCDAAALSTNQSAGGDDIHFFPPTAPNSIIQRALKMFPILETDGNLLIESSCANPPDNFCKQNGIGSVMISDTVQSASGLTESVDPVYSLLSPHYRNSISSDMRSVSASKPPAIGPQDADFGSNPFREIAGVKGQEDLELTEAEESWFREEILQMRDAYLQEMRALRAEFRCEVQAFREQARSLVSRLARVRNQNSGTFADSNLNEESSSMLAMQL